MTPDELRAALAALDPARLDAAQREAVGRAIAADPLLDVSVWAGWLGVNHADPQAQAAWQGWCAEGVAGEGSAGAVIVPLARSLGWAGPTPEADGAGAARDSPPPDARDDGGGQRLSLPPWGPVRAVEPPMRSPALVDGLLRAGHVGVLAGPAKAGKTYIAMHLAVSVATGGSWLGRRCRRGRTLFVDPEVDPSSAHARFARLADALGADRGQVSSSVDLWSLRGVPDAGIERVVGDLAARCEFGDYALVVLDSASVFVEGDENSSVDVRRFFARALRVAAISGAGVLATHHYGKGAAGDRSAGERARGSSVWLDAPDAALTLTPVEPPEGSVSDYLGAGESAYLFEAAGLREFPPMEPFHVIYSHPMHRLDEDGITAGWKPRSGQQTGGRRSGDARRAKADLELSRFESRLLFAFAREGIDPDEGMTLRDACDVCGCAANTAKVRVEASRYFALRKPSRNRCYVALLRTPEDEK